MEIVFGLFADGGGVPDHGGDSVGSLGHPVLGPTGLLDMLELMHGLSGPSAAKVVRVAAWRRALAIADTGERFWSRSFAVDAWSTARTLLGWRDVLVESGWTSAFRGDAHRLLDLAAAEAVADMPSGAADRLVRLAKQIRADITNRVTCVRLIDARDHHSIGWRRLFDALEAHGVTIGEVAREAAAPAHTALGALQRWLLGDAPHADAPDGTVSFANALSEVLASELVGQWVELANGNGSLTLIAQGGDTQLVDHGLALSGQPRAGRSQASPHRGALQLLLLGFKTAWAPFDAHALMELLLFTHPPIAPRAAARLAAALEEAPGRGSSVWVSAWEDVETDARAATGGDKKDGAAVDARITRWREWAEPDLYDPEEGIPLNAALAICDRTIAWAIARHSSDQDPLYLATARLASDVRGALVALDLDRAPRLLIDRLIEEALGHGEPDPTITAEAACWRSIAHPGAMWAPTDNVVWWTFCATESLPRPPWTDAERHALADAGLPLDNSNLMAKTLNAAWERAVLNARRHLLFVGAGLEALDDSGRHPLAHRLAPALAASAEWIRLEDALTAPSLQLAGQELARVPVEVKPLPPVKPSWPTPNGFADRLAGRSQSATAFENLFECQLRWALQHVAQLRIGRARAIPDENRLFGNLAHALARDIFTSGSPPTSEVAVARTTERLDAVIDQLAAPLRHPRYAGELAFARRRLPDAMAALAHTLRANNLTVEATELPVSGEFADSLAVRGSIDLVARDSKGEPVIVDLKWSRSGKSRITELESGNSVQLATYGAMLSGENPYRAGYFLLNQRQFATLAASGLLGRQVLGRRSLRDTWGAILSTWHDWRQCAHDGKLIALGVEGSEALVPAGLALVREVHCEWCDYATLCRVRGQQ
jgi:ATP-dependent helicase/nuclease subunit B